MAQLGKINPPILRFATVLRGCFVRTSKDPAAPYRFIPMGFVGEALARSAHSRGVPFNANGLAQR